MAKQNAVVTDLDGTIIDGNSLIWIIRLGLKHLIKRFRFGSVFAVLSLGLLLKLKLIKHETMKYRVLRLFGDDPGLFNQLRIMGDNHRNRAVLEILDEARASGSRILLATAASSNYVSYLWSGEYVASPFGGPDIKGIRKVELVNRWLDDNNLDLSAFLTDHSDDLPMARMAAERGATVYLVNPGIKSMRKFKEAAIPFVLIRK